MKAIPAVLLAIAFLSASASRAEEAATSRAAEAARPTQGKGAGPTHDRGAQRKGAEELPSGAQTGGMRTGVPEGAGPGDRDPSANHPSTTGPDSKANPDNPRGAGTENSRRPASR